VRQTAVFSYSDVTTSVAVLLGVFPPVDVSQSSALKLDSVLVPDPFCRPRAVLLLNIMGVDSELLSEWTAQEILGKSLFQQRPLSTVDSQLFELSGSVLLDPLYVEYLVF
jgi:hypothetical protein